MQITRLAKAAVVAMFAITMAVQVASADVSGAYFAEYEFSFEMIQLIEKRDGTIVGRMESYSYHPTQKPNVTVRLIEGAVSENSVLLVFPNDLLDPGPTMSMSGEVQAGELSLIWEVDESKLQRASLSKRNEILERILVRSELHSASIK